MASNLFKKIFIIIIFVFPSVGTTLGSFQAPNKSCNKYKWMHGPNVTLAVSCVVSWMHVFILPIIHLKNLFQIIMLRIKDAKKE